MDKIEETISKIGYELAEFHKTQKTGFHTFDPYRKDFGDNLFSFWTGVIFEKYLYKKGKAGIDPLQVFRSSWMPYDRCFGAACCIKEDGCPRSHRHLYWVYPDCVKASSGIEFDFLLMKATTTWYTYYDKYGNS